MRDAQEEDCFVARKRVSRSGIMVYLFTQNLLLLPPEVDSLINIKMRIKPVLCLMWQMLGRAQKQEANA